MNTDRHGSEPSRAPEGEAYRTLCSLSVASLVCGVLSALVVFGWTLGVIPLCGLLLGRAALKRIRRSPEELSGAALARVGMGLCLAFWAAGSLWLYWAHAKEVPHGYTEVGYEELQGDAATGGRSIPKRALDLDKKKIFVKGYMYPGRQQLELRQFIISRDNGRCNFCMPNPTPTDLVHVTLAGDLRTDYTTHIIALGGTLHVETDPEKIARKGTAYHLDADYIH